MSHTPHYSRVADSPETINAVTGKSYFYGMRPWRCDDRFTDWLSSFTHMDGLGVQFALIQTLWRCASSQKGEEPLDDYYRLERSDVMMYVDRYRSGMMRTSYLERYPYDQNELRRVVEDDALRMRVWRHQRELELESREGRIDEVLHMNVMRHTTTTAATPREEK